MPKKPEINENQLAKKIAEREGLKKQVNITQIKEVLKATLDILWNEYWMSDVCRLIEDHGGRKKR